MLLSTIGRLATKKVESLADLLREFNRRNDVTVAYKAFYNRLAHPSFTELMRRMLARLLEQLSIRIRSLVRGGRLQRAARAVRVCTQNSHISIATLDLHRVTDLRISFNSQPMNTWLYNKIRRIQLTISRSMAMYSA